MISYDDKKLIDAVIFKDFRDGEFVHVIIDRFLNFNEKNGIEKYIESNLDIYNLDYSDMLLSGRTCLSFFVKKK